MSLVRAGKVLLSPFTGVAHWYGSIAQKYPLATGIVTTGLKTSAADAFAQKVGCVTNGPFAQIDR
jgi:hypothetical protein